MVNSLEQMSLATNIIKVKKARGGLYTPIQLMHQKFQLSGIHGCNFTPNKIEMKHIFEKYEWQKPHQSNLTGTDQAYYPNKDKDGAKKKYKSWKE